VIGFFGIYRTQDGGNTWEKTHNHGGWALSSVGNGEGWAVGDDMLAYTPNGEAWSEKPLPSRSSFSSRLPYFSGVYFLDADKGWVIGSEPSVMYTPNGGIDWYEQSVSAETRLMSIDFINNTHGWAVGHGGYILRTTHGDSLGPRLCSLCVQSSKTQSEVGSSGFPDSNQWPRLGIGIGTVKGYTHSGTM
jgi:photosystem II stability/assembly factor-like uncharacterized protein